MSLAAVPGRLHYRWGRAAWACAAERPPLWMATPGSEEMAAATPGEMAAAVVVDAGK